MKPMKTLDLNKPEDAREFITKAVNDVVKETTGSTFSEVTLADGTTKKIADFSDSEAVQYAWELLPILTPGTGARSVIVSRHGKPR